MSFVRNACPSKTPIERMFLSFAGAFRLKCQTTSPASVHSGSYTHIPSHSAKAFPWLRCFSTLSNSSSNVLGQSWKGHLTEALRKPAGRCCGAIWSCALVISDATPQTEVVPKGVEIHHCPTVRKVAQPVRKGARSQQRLVIKHGLHIKGGETHEPPFLWMVFQCYQGRGGPLSFSAIAPILSAS